MKLISRRRAERLAIRLLGFVVRLKRDERGIAAIEFAFIVPLMLVMFFGVVEMSSGLAVDRKVTLLARTLSDLASQSTVVVDSDFTNFFNANSLIMWPYTQSPINATISELYINPTNGQARVQWSKGSAVRSTGSVVTIPTGLVAKDAMGVILPNQYLIYSEVNYLYTPAVGYVMKSGVTLKDVNYTRPRQSTCVLYPATQTLCPTS